MRVVLLGTGDSPGTPVIGCHCKTCENARKHGWERKRFSVMIQNKGKTLLIDTSPDMRAQLLRADVERVDAVIWTHCHYDHFSGFGDFYRVQSNVVVYSSPEVHEDIGKYMEFIKYKPVEVESYEPLDLFGMKVTLIDVNHPPLRRSHGVVVECDGYKVAISGDTNREVPSKSLAEMYNADLFIVEALAPEGYRFRKHMNAVEALSLAKNIGAKRTVLTHLGHFFPPHSQAVKKYPVGYDFQTFTFGEEERLDEFFGP
ncbi:MBL fold metallo-hydrolase [Archaeoglobus veneficus]|uniref:Beta-lactamase domain protein n=1 Tax=Archaeoglobus veneficus (strain DSM 11195 / SNP6) TaxID=693661 RepID=F2KRU1_ARCVS|nr:MBL fold metallo-hydrolase [Archaeoglobus veneficus]AEA47955.1 beta-lactamase domain protein [Archaeoglobus veneficus SNP6]